MAGRSRFRGTDEVLAREIETIEEITKVRLRQAARQLTELDRDLRELRAERAKRRARIRTEVLVTDEVAVPGPLRP